MMSGGSSKDLSENWLLKIADIPVFEIPVARRQIVPLWDHSHFTGNHVTPFGHTVCTCIPRFFSASSPDLT